MIFIKVIQDKGYWTMSSEYNIDATQEEVIEAIKNKFTGKEYKIEIKAKDITIFKNGEKRAEIQMLPNYNCINAKDIASYIFDDIN